METYGVRDYLTYRYFVISVDISHHAVRFSQKPPGRENKLFGEDNGKSNPWKIRERKRCIYKCWRNTIRNIEQISGFRRLGKACGSLWAPESLAATFEVKNQQNGSGNV